MTRACAFDMFIHFIYKRQDQMVSFSFVETEAHATSSWPTTCYIDEVALDSLALVSLLL